MLDTEKTRTQKKCDAYGLDEYLRGYKAGRGGEQAAYDKGYTAGKKAGFYAGLNQAWRTEDARASSEWGD
jgi:hypothetical protein